VCKILGVFKIQIVYIYKYYGLHFIRMYIVLNRNTLIFIIRGILSYVYSFLWPLQMRKEPFSKFKTIKNHLRTTILKTDFLDLRLE